jgi:aldose 1-epimerase
MTATGETRYGVERGYLGEQPLVTLTDRSSRRCLRIAQRGAALLGFEVPLGDASYDLADGHRNAAEIAARPGSRFAIMVPFAGRVADARYVFDGQVEDLQPGVVGAERASRHGFVRDTEFQIGTLAADDQSARLCLTTSAIRPQPGYPHAIDLALIFTLDDVGLTLEARMRNVGDTVAPCFFGWHPYFRLADSPVDGWQLQIPAETLISTDADLIALPGDAAYVPLEKARAFDFRHWRDIGDSVLDQGYADLSADADGRIRTRLRNPANGLGIAVWQERGVMHAFTSDTVSRDARRAIALEPMECMANAFNRADAEEAIRLEPGAERHFRCGVEVEYS